MAQQVTQFRDAARLRYMPLPLEVGGTMADAVNPNQPFRATLPKTGLLAEIVMQVTGTMTLGAPGALRPREAHNILQSIQVMLNASAAAVYSTTGWGNRLIQHAQGYNPILADARIYSAPVAAAANAWVLTYRIPVAFQTLFEGALPGDAPIGVIDLQALGTQCVLQGRWGTGLDAVAAFGGGAGFAGTLTAGMYYWDVPAGAVQRPARILWRTVEDTQVPVAAGDQDYNVPPEGDLMRLLHTVVMSDARLDTCNNHRLVINRSDFAWTRALRWEMAQEDLRRYRALLPTGVYAWDAVGDWGQPGGGDKRDSIDFEGITELHSILSTGATAPGGVENGLYTVRQFFQAY